jgi:hypothetical protein
MIAPEITTTTTWECVHFGTLLEGRKEIERCRERGLTALQVDLAGVQEKSELLARIASAMKFPDSFGMNWDALADSLRDLSWLNPKGVLVRMLGYLLSTITIIHRKRYTWTRTQDPPATASQVAQDFRRHRREKGCPIFRVLLRKVGTTDACSKSWAVLRTP